MTSPERWRDRMPFRKNWRLWTERMNQQGRGGEPSPSSAHPQADPRWAEILHLWDWMDNIRYQGHGKAHGSFTERVRKEFRAWQERNGLDAWADPITFEYRLHRRKRIMVSLTRPHIYHRKIRGDGSKGFVLEGTVISVDGVPPARHRLFTEFALNRIIGHQIVPLLAAAKQNALADVSDDGGMK